ncbi:hypothetical protein HJG60_011079 [Phyllostomus discolor]|uniref:Uncharacterized protein n=1 Tax=Phyllostomus discolor TaxID=89673 RepID=A0A834AF60_9CHIR|nr:hypothetical protein HJG60_011079 [Phyllostomus discolor]
MCTCPGGGLFVFLVSKEASPSLPVDLPASLCAGRGAKSRPGCQRLGWQPRHETANLTGWDSEQWPRDPCPDVQAGSETVVTGNIFCLSGWGFLVCVPPAPPQFSFGENWRPADLLFLDCSLLSLLPVNLPVEGAGQGSPRPGKGRRSADNHLRLHQSQGIFASSQQRRGAHGLCPPPMPVFV